jgi:hypothetical protein
MIAEKQLENDTRTGLVRKVEIVGIDIQSNKALKNIKVSCEVNLYSNNEFVVTEKTFVYQRFGAKFDTLESSPLGQGIKAMLGLDLDLIISLDTIETDLAQNV